MRYLKMSLDVLLQNSVQQNHLSELYTLYLLLTKNTPSLDVALLPPPDVDCPHLPQTLWENLGIGGESHQIAKYWLISSARKISLNK